MADFYKIYHDAVEENNRTYDTANFGALMKLIYSSKIRTWQTTEKDHKNIRLISGLRVKGVTLEQHYSTELKQLFVSSKLNFWLILS